MRVIENQDINGSSSLGKFSMYYPDNVVFAFNPLYLDITIENNNISKLIVEVDFPDNAFIYAKSITVNLYKGKAKVYYSRLLELFFDDVKHERAKTLAIRVKGEIVSGMYTFASFTHLVIWGSIALGERFFSNGIYHYDSDKPYYERCLIWFKNYPFTVTMLQSGYSSNGESLRVMYDNNSFDPTLNIFVPTFNLMVDNIDDAGFDDITDSLPLGKTIDIVVYASKQKRFYGVYDNSNLCLSWLSGNGYYDSTYYMAGSRPRTDIKFGYNERFYTYNLHIDMLYAIPYGHFGNTGLYELDPSLTFGSAKNFAVYSSVPSVFDNTFDDTFVNARDFTSITKLIINNKAEGYYLRWIDRFGCFQYYLFDKGKHTIKNEPKGEKISERDFNIGMWFPNHDRIGRIDGNITNKCCASSLDENIYAYVSSIITSPIIDLYLGKTKFGEEMWVPVNIVASAHDYDPTKILHDLEISFTMPEISAQNI